MRHFAFVSLLVAAFFADYFDAFAPVGLLLKAGMTVTFLVVFLPSCMRVQRGSMIAVMLAGGSMLYGVMRFTTVQSSTYELAKLTLAIVLVLGCINASRRPLTMSAAPVVLETALRKALGIALTINGAAVFFQVIFGDSVLILLGVPESYFDAPEKAGRYSGLILNLPLWSAMLFARIVLADSRLFPCDSWPASGVRKFFLYLLLILSGQKYVIIFTAVYLLVRVSRSVKLILFALILACIPLIKSSENSQISDRVNQAATIVEIGVPALIAQADAEVDYPQFSFLDLRLNSWLYAWANIKASPVGRGLGTWGDYSASFNAALENPVTLSETQWAHLIVEQGIGAVVLMLLFSAPFLFAHRALLSNLKLLGCFIFIAGWFTMGSSDYLWFYVVYALLFNLRGLQRVGARRCMEVNRVQAP